MVVTGVPVSDVPSAGGTVRLDAPLPLDCGAQLEDVVLHHESWGELSARRDNVVLVCHSLTKTSHARSGRADPRPGWWETAIGPGRMIDTDRWFVICTDTLAAGASTGPASTDPATGRPYGMRFPVVTVADMVRAQQALLDQLGITRLACVIGGCFGGQQAVQWAISRPDRVQRQVSIAVTPSTSAHSIAVFAVMRQLIRSDPAWKGGDYHGGPPPTEGFARSIAAAMPLWMSRDAMERRFGRRRVAGAPRYSMEPEFTVEQFIADLAHPHPDIDANGLMYLTRAVEYFDLAVDGDVAAALAGVRAASLLVSYAGDWRYPGSEVEQLHRGLVAGGAPSRHLRLENPMGHGAFMYDLTDLGAEVAAFLDRPVT